MRQGFAAALVVGVALALSGCALGMSEFSRTAANTGTGAPAVKEAVMEEGAIPLRPAALVEEDVAPVVEKSPAAVAAETVVPTSTYPNLNVIPTQPKGKLLSPEEKQKVIAELEALARSQGDALAKERATAAAACDNLSATELRKRMLQGAC
ncbi:MAG: hypothetical protein WDM94_10425 [Bauldia sp.]